MKTLVVICALVACCTAVPQSWGYSSIDTGVWGNSILSPSLLATRTIAAPYAYSSLASPYAYSSHAAPYSYSSLAAPYAYAAPAVAVTRTVATPVVAAAPVVAAPAPVVAAAPAVAVTRTVAAPVVAAPTPIISAAPEVVAVAPEVVAVAPAVTKTQYHSQDELGQASYGHSEPLQTHNAVQDAHGNKVGSFSYLNPHDGQIHRTDYVADALGYRVAANDLPIDTAEVAIAKAAHLSAHAAARSKRSVLAVAETPASTSPLATPIVASPLAYSTLAYPAPVAPLAYSSIAAPVAAPLAYSSIAAPLAYSSIAAPVAAPLAYSSIAAAPALRAATLTQVVNNPGHAVSYRVD